MEAARYRTKWLPVQGFEGLYEVSNGGRVRSLRHNKKLLKQYTTEKGYKRVRLIMRCGTPVWRKVHRIVAIAHIPNPECKTEVNHIRGVKWDNRASQLEWMTRAENLQHMRDEGLTRGPGKKRRKSNTNGRTKEVFRVKESRDLHTKRKESFHQ